MKTLGNVIEGDQLSLTQLPEFKTVIININ